MKATCVRTPIVNNLHAKLSYTCHVCPNEHKHEPSHFQSCTTMTKTLLTLLLSMDFQELSKLI